MLELVTSNREVEDGNQLNTTRLMFAILVWRRNYSSLCRASVWFFVQFPAVQSQETKLSLRSSLHSGQCKLRSWLYNVCLSNLLFTLHLCDYKPPSCVNTFASQTSGQLGFASSWYKLAASRSCFHSISEELKIWLQLWWVSAAELCCHWWVHVQLKLFPFELIQDYILLNWYSVFMDYNA